MVEKKIGSSWVIYLLLLIANISGYSQNNSNNYIITHEDSLSLENIIVEKYYIADSNDCKDTSTWPLPKGAVTYRIYVDMKPGYNLQMVYGNQKHELFIETTTTFYNELSCHAYTGFNIDAKRLHIDNVALDSWITMGAASKLHTGVLRSEDTDGYSFILNRPSFKNSDGLTKGVLPNFKVFNLDLSFFNNDSTAKRFSTTNGGWAAPGGVKGPLEDKNVLIAQLTTNGQLSFEINLQIGTPAGGYIQFVAKNPEGNEIRFDGLSYK